MVRFFAILFVASAFSGRFESIPGEKPGIFEHVSSFISAVVDDVASRVGRARAHDQAMVSGKSQRMQKIAVLLQSMDKATWTDNITGVIDSILTMLDDDVVAEMKKEHASTQDHITSLSTDLISKEAEQKRSKTSAETTSSNEFDCMVTEKQKAKTFEDNNALLASAILAEATAKKARDAAAMINTTMADLSYQCTATSDDCDSKIAAIDTFADSEINTTKSSIQVKVAAYNTAFGTWSTANAKMIQNQTDTNTARQNYNDEVTTCKSLYPTDTFDHICEWTKAAEASCASWRNWADLKDKVQNQKGNVYSEKDRQEEWEAVQQVKCLLKNYKTQTQASSTCDDQTNFIADNSDVIPFSWVNGGLTEADCCLEDTLNFRYFNHALTYDSSGNLITDPSVQNQFARWNISLIPEEDDYDSIKSVPPRTRQDWGIETCSD